MPMRPRSRTAWIASRGNRCSRSTSSAWARTVESATSRTASRSARWCGPGSNCIANLKYVSDHMEAGPRYLEGTTVGSGRDIIGVRRDRIAAIIEQGREIISRAKQEKILPDTITGPTAALLVTISGYGEPLSEGQWRELSGVVGGIMRDPPSPDLARPRHLRTQGQLL